MSDILYSIFVDYLLPVTYFLLGAAAIGAIVLPLINSLSNPKMLLGSLIGVAVIGVIFLISYGTASGEVTDVYEKFNVDSSTSKLVGASINTMFTLMILGIVGIIITEVSKLFK